MFKYFFKYFDKYRNLYKLNLIKKKVNLINNLYHFLLKTGYKFINYDIKIYLVNLNIYLKKVEFNFTSFYISIKFRFIQLDLFIYNEFKI